MSPGLHSATVTFPISTLQQCRTQRLLRSARFLTISVSRSYGEFSQTSAYATLTVPLGSRTSVTGEASTARSGEQRTSYIGAAVQRTLPSDEGIGYRLRATTHEQFDAGVGYTWPFGEYTVEASSFEGSSAARATASGGVGVIAGRAFMSRLITDSFGLVRVGDLEGIRVFHEGNPIGRTDRSGEIVLPRHDTLCGQPHHDRRARYSDRCRYQEPRNARRTAVSLRHAGRIRCAQTCQCNTRSAARRRLTRALGVRSAACRNVAAATSLATTEKSLFPTCRSHRASPLSLRPAIAASKSSSVRRRKRCQSLARLFAVEDPCEEHPATRVACLRRIGQRQHAGFRSLFMQRIQRRID